MNYPSIFNDVIGPVMRGPSSSHCAAAVRIGRMARDLMDGRIERVRLQFDTAGSLATTHRSQGSDMGFFGGLLGWDAQDERLADSERALVQAGIRVEIGIADLGDPHPNTYRVTLERRDESHRLIALSTGGGMVEITQIDGVPLSIQGDYVETLLWVAGGAEDLASRLQSKLPAEEVLLRAGEGRTLVQVKSRIPIPEEMLKAAIGAAPVLAVHRIAPVLPILSRRGIEVPFITAEQMLAESDGSGPDLARLAAAYESARGGIPAAEVTERMTDIVRILRRSIAQGLAGTRHADRILGHQSGAFQAAAERNALLDGGAAEPHDRLRHGADGGQERDGGHRGGADRGLVRCAPRRRDRRGRGPGRCTEADMARAMLAAGVIGVFIAHTPPSRPRCADARPSAARAPGMAAAALVTLAGGNARQAVDAASHRHAERARDDLRPGGQPGRGPCLGRNVLAAANALACANMALAGFDPVVPLDEVIETMLRVGRSLPSELRCTARGGLSITPAARRIEARLTSGSNPNG